MKEPIPIENSEATPDAKRKKSRIKGSELKRPSRQGAASCNPWDYLIGNGALGVAAEVGEDGKSKARRRFTKKELEALEVLWSLHKNPTKYQRQRLGAWIGA
jgi:hypothetical protein